MSIGAAIILNAFFAVPLIRDFLPQPKPTEATVRLAAGSLSFNPDKDGRGTGGEVPSIAIYDILGNKLGNRVPRINELIHDGSLGDYRITTGGSAEYIKVGYDSVTHDPMCLSYLQVTSSGGQDFFIWNGDYGKQCGMPWYPSELRFPGDSQGFCPARIRRGRDGTPAAVSVKVSDFFFRTAPMP